MIDFYIGVVVVWLIIGLFAAFSNAERVARMYPYPSCHGINFMQNFLTIYLGPVGLLLVLSCGGKLRFWNEAE
jgi:hypothetical protein